MTMKLFLLTLVTGSALFAQEKDIMIWSNGDDDGTEFVIDEPDFPMAKLPGMELAFSPMFEAALGGDEGDFVLMAGDDAQKDLNITKEQREKMKKIRQDAKKANIPLKSQLELKGIELKELMDAETANKDAIAAKIKEIDAVKTQIKINSVNARIDSRNVLTKEQREKIEQMKNERHMMWMGDGPGRPKMKMRKFLRDERD